MWGIKVGHWDHSGPVSHAYKEVSAIGKIATPEHVTHDMRGCGTKFIAIGIQIIPLLLLLLPLLHMLLVLRQMLLRQVLLRQVLLRQVLLWQLLWALLRALIRLHVCATRLARKWCVCQLETLPPSRHSLCGIVWCHCENQTSCRRPVAVLIRVWTIHLGKPILIVAHHTISLTIPLLRVVRIPQASGTMWRLPSSGQ